MKFQSILAAFALGAAALVAAPASAEQFILNMSGDQEVPPADLDGFATGTVTIDKTTNTVSWNFVYGDIAAPTLMHIHTGAAGVNGPVLVNMGVATSGGPGTLIGSTVTTMANINLILANPPGFYVNIHNAPFPGGAVRGQLIPAPPTVFNLEMSGDQEVPGPGDPDGTAMGTLTVDPGTNTISWDFTYENISDPTLMHIHTGAFGVGGPVFVGLGVETTGGPGTLIDSLADITNEVITALLDDPAGYYVNIHNDDFPAGAVRGQLENPQPPPCPSDFNQDGLVDGGDLGTLLAAWGSSAEQEDLNGDGTVDGADLGILLGAWGPCPTI